MMLPFLSVVQAYFHVKAQPPNARIKLPDNNCGTDQFSMKATLSPVSLNELLGCL
jgi:hypothetical protein